MTEIIVVEDFLVVLSLVVFQLKTIYFKPCVMHNYIYTSCLIALYIYTSIKGVTFRARSPKTQAAKHARGLSEEASSSASML